MTVSTSFFAELVDGTGDLHARTLDHPTVRGIGDGSLPEETFRFYIEQDFQYLLRYVQVIALAAASTDDITSTLNLSKLVYSTVDLEIDALRDLYRRFGGVPELLDSVPPAPTCVAYTSHLQATALQRNLFITLAAVLPCQWGYREIGRKLKAAGMPADERYAAWIESYTSEEYSQFVDWALDRFDELARQHSGTYRDRARTAFELSSRYELGFWKMAWNHQSWGQQGV